LGTSGQWSDPMGARQLRTKEFCRRAPRKAYHSVAAVQQQQQQEDEEIFVNLIGRGTHGFGASGTLNVVLPVTAVYEVPDMGHVT